MSTPRVDEPPAVELRTFADADALADAAAELVATLAAAAVRERGRFVVALAGGTTPAATYRRLATGWRAAVPWEQVEIWYGDERAVPPDDAASNHDMARAALLDRVSIPGHAIHRIPAELGATAGAHAYDEALRQAFGEPWMGAATFDLALLGVGDDGHTASLFPGDPALDVTDRWAVAAGSPDPARPWPRVTLTLPALCGAATVVVLAAGAAKRPVVRAVLDRGAGGMALPVARARGRRRTLWLVDAAATP